MRFLKILIWLRGRTTEEDKRGNDGADALAVDGAKLHNVSSEVLDAALQRKQWALQVQRMMVAVLQARFGAESYDPHDVVNDRGSDCESDCMELECMELDCMELLDDDVDNGEGTLNGAS